MIPANRSRVGGVVRPPAALIAIFCFIFLSGCTSNSTRTDPSAKALFDVKSGDIVMPLDQYDELAGEANKALLNEASDIAVGRCMTKAGFQFSAGTVSDTAFYASVGDRTYGVWDEGRALKFGFGTAPDLQAQAIANDAKTFGAPWKRAYDNCANGIPREVAGMFPSQKQETDSIVTRIRTQAYNDALADPRWQDARKKWWGCLRKVGLTPRTGDNEWGTKQDAEIAKLRLAKDPSYSFEDEIRVADLEAKCNDQTAMARTLANLEASYQVPLIRQNQAALNVEKTKINQRLALARSYVAQYG